MSETGRIIHVCESCGTPGVTREAWAAWDVAAQAWVLAELFDYAFCHRCHRRTRLETRKVGDMGDETLGMKRRDVEE